MRRVTADRKMASAGNLLLISLILCLLVFRSDPAFCQSEEQASAKSVGEQSFAAIKSGKADDYVKMILPDERARFKTSMLLIADMAKAKDQEKSILTLFEVPDRESLEKLTADEFLSRIMKKQLTPAATALYAKAEFKIVGVVMEGSDVAHCVYLLTIPGIMSKPDVISLKKDGKSWGVLLTTDLEKMLQTLKTQLAQQPDGNVPVTPELKAVKVLGTVLDADSAYVVFRSTTAINGAPIEKVGQIKIGKAEPEYKHVTADDKVAIEKYIEKKVNAFASLAASIAALRQSANLPPEGPAGPDMSLRTIKGSSSSVDAVAFSPVGPRLASAEDKQMTLWDTSKGQRIRSLPKNANSIYSIAWSPDGKLIASGDSEGTLTIMDPGVGRVIRRQAKHSGAITAIAFSRDGQKIASSGGSHDGTIRIWASGTAILLRTIAATKDPEDGLPNSIMSLAFSPDGKQVAAGYSDATIRTWDTITGKLFKKWKADRHGIETLAFSPNGKQLASAGDDLVKIWDPASGKLVHELSGHKSTIKSLSFSPKGEMLVSGSYDKTIKFWDLKDFSLKQSLSGHTESVDSVSWSADGKSLASGSADGTIKIWDVPR